MVSNDGILGENCAVLGRVRGAIVNGRFLVSLVVIYLVFVSLKIGLRRMYTISTGSASRVKLSMGIRSGPMGSRRGGLVLRGARRGPALRTGACSMGKNAFDSVRGIVSGTGSNSAVGLDKGFASGNSSAVLLGGGLAVASSSRTALSTGGGLIVLEVFGKTTGSRLSGLGFVGKCSSDGNNTVLVATRGIAFGGYIFRGGFTRLDSKTVRARCGTVSTRNVEVGGYGFAKGRTKVTTNTLNVFTRSFLVRGYVFSSGCMGKSNRYCNNTIRLNLSARPSCKGIGGYLFVGGGTVSDINLNRTKTKYIEGKSSCCGYMFVKGATS